MKKLMKLIKNEDGSTLVLVALLMVVLLGFAALVVDVGNLYLTKTQLQNAADAAALAGAQELPTASTAKSTAIYFTGQNGVQASETKPNTPYNYDKTKIEVVCTRTVHNYFAGVLGAKFATTDVSARAVAKKNRQWAGEALPFLNMGFNYSDSTDVTAWTKVAPGIKGDIYDFRTFTNDSGKHYYELEYKDGLMIKPGFAGGLKGLDDSKLKDSLGDVLDPIGKKVFLFSLRSDLIKDWHCKVNNEKNFTSINKLKNYDVINPDQLVLIECTLVGYDKSNLHNIQLTYTGNVFDLGNNVTGNDLPDYPTDNLSSTDGSSSLVE